MNGVNMKLEDLGYNEDLEKARVEQNLEGFGIGRVIAEHKERYVVKTAQGDLEAEVTGHMRFTAQDREDFPAVGDWVALTSFDAGYGIIHQILPRFSSIKRKAAGQTGETQLIAANIDFAFLVQASDRDFNINRLERYLTICYESRVKPIIVLTKIDLEEESRISAIIQQIEDRIRDVPVLPVSNRTLAGFAALKKTIKKGKSYCLLGSSGVGKSTLLNNLSQSEVMNTGALSQSTNKGRHISSHRELVMLEKGGLLIDNPGMREVGIAEHASGLENTFYLITSLAQNCKYTDCTHTRETGCAVLEALETGDLDHGYYENYIKMEREKSHFQSTMAQKRKKDKEFGKMLKNFKNDMKNFNPDH
jgi:ribosome biogenesis GTPase